MNKLLVIITIGILLAFLTGGWYLGQVQGNLAETKVELAIAKNQLLVQSTELSLVKRELEKMEQKLEQGQPRHFISLEELNAWLTQDNTNNMQYFTDSFNCFDFALMLQAHALEDGYILSMESPPIAYHWLNSAFIDDTIYLIEPQNDEIFYSHKIK